MTTMISNKSSLIAITLSMVFTLLLNANLTIDYAYSLPVSPQQQSVPKLDFNDPAMSIVVIVQLEKPKLTDIEKATVMSIAISPERARTHVADPPLLKVVLVRKDNLIKEQFNTWTPLWALSYNSNGQESLNTLKKANGTIIFPFDRNLAFMDLYSQPSGKFITRINLNATVENFCNDNPKDPNCKPVITNKFCKNNPKDPNCQPSARQIFCRDHPLDLRCKRSLGSLNNTTSGFPINTTSGFPGSS